METLLRDEIRTLGQEKFELMKMVKRQGETIKEHENRNGYLITELEKANSWGAQAEDTAAQEQQKCELAAARVLDLVGQIEYLKGEIKLYQERLGLLPQQRQSQTVSDLKPLRQARKPFNIVAHEIEKKRNEEYWKAQADRAHEKLGTSGLTTESTPDGRDTTSGN